MYQFFIERDQITPDGIVIWDEKDVNHIKNVLRMTAGEQISLLCQETEKEYICHIASLSKDGIIAEIEDINGESRELPCEITLFQGLPKGDKMELIIQKAVELGASRVVPVAMKRSVMKLDEKKAAKKVARWNEIAVSAAKQSKRTRIPEVTDVMSYKKAMEEASGMDLLLLPYEDARGISHARNVLASAVGKERIGIIIGPEGGFSPDEVTLGEQCGAEIITLGKRILRTETAGMTTLSILMFNLERE